MGALVEAGRAVWFWSGHSSSFARETLGPSLTKALNHWRRLTRAWIPMRAGAQGGMPMKPSAGGVQGLIEKAAPTLAATAAISKVLFVCWS